MRVLAARDKIMKIKEKRMSLIFNEWARRYSENPDDFGKILGEDGEPIEDYGESCMRFFCWIEKEMDEAHLLPAVSQKEM